MASGSYRVIELGSEIPFNIAALALNAVWDKTPPRKELDEIIDLALIKLNKEYSDLAKNPEILKFKFTKDWIPEINTYHVGLLIVLPELRETISFAEIILEKEDLIEKIQDKAELLHFKIYFELKRKGNLKKFSEWIFDSQSKKVAATLGDFDTNKIYEATITHSLTFAPNQEGRNIIGGTGEIFYKED